jgi:hypothetical protein
MFKEYKPSTDIESKFYPPLGRKVKFVDEIKLPNKIKPQDVESKLYGKSNRSRVSIDCKPNPLSVDRPLQISNQIEINQFIRALFHEYTDNIDHEFTLKMLVEKFKNYCSISKDSTSEGYIFEQFNEVKIYNYLDKLCRAGFIKISVDTPRSYILDMTKKPKPNSSK